MLKEQIVVGKAYVNGQARLLREVVEELDGQCVKFHAFDLATGRLSPSRHRTCRKEEMADWAEREATPGERARIHPFEEAAWTEPAARRTDRSIDLEAAKAALEASAGPHAFPPAK